MSDDRVAVLVFARAPLPGRTKTRLAAAIGAERAAELSSAFLADTLRTVSSIPALAPAIWAASDEDAEILRAHALPVHVQPDADLGARMCAALVHGLSQHRRALVIGSDAPSLPARLLISAIDALADADAVLGPCADGGYYLLGARSPLPPIERVRWSSAHTLRDTLHALRELRVRLLAPWFDVDDAESLALLCTELALSPARAPETARVLRSASLLSRAKGG